MPVEEINYFAHLDELRNRIIVILLVLVVLTGVSFFLSEPLVEIVTRPIRQNVGELYFLSPYEALLVRLRVAFASGLVLSAPLVFALLWTFVSPGLYVKERKVIFPLSLASILLFFSGVLAAHFFVIPFTLKFFLAFQTGTLRPLISVGAYLSLYLSLILIFGGISVTPVILIGLMKLGIVNPEMLSRQRKMVILLAFILGAVLTPTMDMVTQCLVALPLWMFFEISIILGRWICK